MQTKFVIIFIIAIAVVGAGAYYFGYQKGFDAGKEVGMAAAETEPGAAVTNPLENFPETNPFKKTINPFKDLYNNPFK